MLPKRKVVINAPSDDTKEQSAKTKAEIERLVAMGFDRRDISVLPDGSVTLIKHNQSQVNSKEGEAAKNRLEQMIARKQELDYMATATAVAGLTLDPDVELEYKKLTLDIEEALKAAD